MNISLPSFGKKITTLVFALSIVLSSAYTTAANALAYPETEAWQQSAKQLPDAVSDTQMVTHNGYVYAIGGQNNNGTDLSSTYFTHLNSDGSINDWQTSANTLPMPTSEPAIVVHGDYVYVISGHHVGTDPLYTTTYYAHFEPNGDIGAWQTSSNSLPDGVIWSSGVVSGDYVYVIGGYDKTTFSNTVRYAHFESNGDIDAWQTSSNLLPDGLIRAAAVVYNGYVYLIGGTGLASGYSGTAVYYAQLTTSGTGVWQTSTNSFPAGGVTDGAATVHGGYVYVAGGYRESENSPNTDVHYAQLTTSGVGAWQTSVNSLPLGVAQSGVALNGDYMYIIGGYTAYTTQTLTQFAKLFAAPVINSGQDTTTPNNGDANNDGVQDITQANVKGLVNPVTGNYVAIETGSGCSLGGQSIAAESTLASQDSNYSYPSGLANFTVTGCSTPGYTTTVTQYYYGATGTNYVLRKYNATTKQYQTVAGATIGKVTIGGQAVTKVTYQVTDGGALDEDGVANGTIVDPAGLAVVTTAPDTGYGQPQHPQIAFATIGLMVGLLLSCYGVTLASRGLNSRK